MLAVVVFPSGNKKVSLLIEIVITQQFDSTISQYDVVPQNGEYWVNFCDEQRMVQNEDLIFFYMN